MHRLLFSFLIVTFLFSTATVRAGEGMWLPLLLKSLNEAEMQSMGLKLSAEDIYSVNKGSLKDAIVHFGGFCTGEVISSEGLLLTNHHCGYGQIQRHSSLQDNYLEDGFWAASKDQELPNPGLFVTFIVSMEDVSEAALEGVTRKMKDKERQSIIDQNLEAIKSKYKREKYQDVMIKPFFHGNEYYLFVTETYNDIRLVGAPPSSIGKYGADTDNWEWPRHAGDFSLFRIYTGPDGKPAEYSEKNVPMKPRYHLPVSTQGVKEGDFTMVFGFPGRTDEYLPAKAVEIRTQVINPIRINMRDSSLAVIDEQMRKDPAIKIQYASKQARIANAWKKWIGESEGVAKTGAIAKKLALQKKFAEKLALVKKKRVDKTKKRYEEKVDEKMRDPEKEKENKKGEDKASDGSGLIKRLEQAYVDQQPYAETRAYLAELNYNIELFRLSNRLSRLPKILQANGVQELENRSPAMLKYLESFYKDYRYEVDLAVAQKLIPIYLEGVNEAHLSKFAKSQVEFAGSQKQMVTDLFKRSFLIDGESAMALLKEDPEKFVAQLQGDMAYQFVRKVNEESKQVVDRPYQRYQDQIKSLQRRGRIVF